MCVWGALNMYEMGQGIPLQPQRGDSEDPCRESLGVTCPQAMGEAYVLLLPLLSLGESHYLNVAFHNGIVLTEFLHF